jgi:hypothetical protein
MINTNVLLMLVDLFYLAVQISFYSEFVVKLAPITKEQPVKNYLFRKEY